MFPRNARCIHIEVCHVSLLCLNSLKKEKATQDADNDISNHSYLTPSPPIIRAHESDLNTLHAGSALGEDWSCAVACVLINISPADGKWVHMSAHLPE